MTQRKISNCLYQHVLSAINNTLPMEYAIRATRKEYPNQFSQLIAFDEEMRKHWIHAGIETDIINNEALMDNVWDLIQCGYILTRIHDRIYPKEFLVLINKTAKEIVNKYAEKIKYEIHIPSSSRFRYCDLINGNNIEELICDTHDGIMMSNNYSKKDSIPLQYFPTIREPVNLYPETEFQYIQTPEILNNKPAFGIFFTADAKVEDIRNSINEYLYQFAKIISKEATHGRLIDTQLLRLYNGEVSVNEIKRKDGFMSFLSGIYCWDCYHLERNNTTLEQAIEKTLSLKYLQDYDDETIKSNYKKVHRKILNITKTWCGIASQPLK